MFFCLSYPTVENFEMLGNLGKKYELPPLVFMVSLIARPVMSFYANLRRVLLNQFQIFCIEDSLYPAVHIKFAIDIPHMCFDCAFGDG
jgi:hypothetical protein